MSNSVNENEFLHYGVSVKKMDVEDPPYLVDGILPRKAVTVLSGSTGIGKSTISLDWAGHLRTNKDWCGHAVSRSEVIYINGQDWDSLGQRLRTWEENHNGASVNFLKLVDGVNQGVDMSVKGMDSRLIKELDFYDPDLIIFDSFSALTNSKLANDDKAIAKIFSRARNLVRELDTAVLFVHYDNSLSDYADAVVTVNEDSENPGHFYLSTKEEDGGKPFDMEPLRIDGFKNNSSGVLLREDTEVSVENDASTRDDLPSRLRDMLA